MISPGLCAPSDRCCPLYVTKNEKPALFTFRTMAARKRLDLDLKFQLYTQGYQIDVLLGNGGAPDLIIQGDTGMVINPELRRGGD
jgi:hypothetical protein